MAKNEFLPFGTAANANVLPSADYQALPARAAGFGSGVAKSEELNTVWRQGSTMAAVVGQFIADSGVDALDNGDTNTLKDNFKEALDKNTLEGFDSSISFSGHQVLPSGLTQQWGRVSVTTDSQGNFTVTPDALLFPTGVVFGRVDLGESSYAGVNRVIIINTYPNTTLKKNITGCARYADNGSPVINSSVNVTFDVIGS